MKIAFISSVLFSCLLNLNSIEATNRPIIGILVQEFTTSDEKYQDQNVLGFIPASYIKAVESSGARVVPILINQNISYYKWIMNSINGIVLPGGAVWLVTGYPYYDTASILFRLAEKMNDRGISFPIFGICAGFQAMLTIYNNNSNLLMRCDSIYENYPLEFMPNYTESFLFSELDQETLLNLKSLPITVNNHHYCIFPDNFTASNLPATWRITSLSTTSKGLKFIATVEHVRYPFYGVEFHPELVAFHWPEKYDIPHDQRSLRVNRYFYDFLVKKSTLNDNKFNTLQEERASLIYNHNPIYHQKKPHQHYTQTYIFHK